MCLRNRKRAEERRREERREMKSKGRDRITQHLAGEESGLYFEDTENLLEGVKQGDEKETDYLPFKEATPIAKWG